MENSRRLLTCLQYPFAADINFTSRGDIIILVCWLEDRKIRELEIDEREVLRKDSDQWDAAFGAYLMKLGCPFTWSAVTDSDCSNDCISWLIANATSAEYEDASDACLEMEEFSSAEASDVFSLQRSIACGNNNKAEMDVVENSDNSSSSLTNAIDELGMMLNLARTDDDISYLSLIHKKIKFFLTDGSLHCLQTKGADGISLNEFPCPFECSDELIKRTSTILRMLYLSDFAELQSDLNSLIVLGQEYTANPKTNSALGAVGR